MVSLVAAPAQAAKAKCRPLLPAEPILVSIYTQLDLGISLRWRSAAVVEWKDGSGVVAVDLQGPGINGKDDIAVWGFSPPVVGIDGVTRQRVWPAEYLAKEFSYSGAAFKPLIGHPRVERAEKCAERWSKR